MGSPCSTNATKFTNPSVGTIVTAKMVNDMQKPINDEQARRNQAKTSFTVNPVSSVLDASDLAVLKNAIQACLSATWKQSYTAGTITRAAHITELHDNLNNAEVACVCDCNYCTCDCNYCTCDCNYCTCDCNYCTCDCNHCTCNCNYSCTCNCNYSDRRLKTEITYF